MLTYVCSEDSVLAYSVGYGLQDLLGAHVTGNALSESVLGGPAHGTLMPFVVLGLVHERKDLSEEILYISCALHVNVDVLVHLASVYIHLNDGGLSGPLFRVQSYSVAVSRTEGDDQVCLIHRSVGSDGSVHAYESQIEIVIAAYSAGCHKGVHHGDVSLIDESLKFLGRRRCDEAASNVEEGLSGVIYEFGRFLEGILGDLRYGIQRKGSLVCELSHRYGYVLGNVDEDRSAAA